MAASTSSSSLDENAIILISSDGETFEIEEDVAVQIKTIHMSFEDLPLGKKFPLPIVKGHILAKVIEYCKNHAQNNPDNIEEVKNNWDKQFMKEMDLHTLICLLNAADYLNIRPLLNLTCQTVADKIKGNTPEEIREIFNIKNDFTPEEEAQVRKENAWAFDD